MTHPEINNRDPLATVELHNGTVFVARQVRGASTFSMAAGIIAGSSSDVIPGTAHFFEHLPFAETTNFKNGEIHRVLRAHAGEVRASTSQDMTIFDARIPTPGYRLAIKAVADLICRPVLRHEHVIKEAKTIATEWASYAIDQQRQNDHRYRRAAFGSMTPHDVIGTDRSIQAITLDDLTWFYERHYTSDNLIVYLQGDVPPRQMLAEAIEAFVLPNGTVQSRRRPLLFRPSCRIYNSKQSAVTQTTLVFEAPTHTSKTGIAYELSKYMITTLDSPFMTEARHTKRLVYGVSTHSDISRRYAYIAFNFAAFPDHVPEVCDILVRHLAKLAHTPDSDHFQDLKNTMLVSNKEHVTRNPEQNPHNMIVQIANTGVVPPRDGYISDLTRLALDDLAAYALRYYVNSPLSVIYEGAYSVNFLTNKELAAQQLQPEPPGDLSIANKSQMPSPRS